MKKALLISLIFSLSSLTQAQPEFYAEPFLGHPEFRVLALRLPSSAADSVRLQVNVRILYDDLQFVKQDDHYQAGYGLDVFLLKGKDRVITSQHLDRRLSVANYAQTNSRLHGDQNALDFILPLEAMTLRVTIVDEESRKARTLEKELTYPEKEWKGALQLGDLALYDSTGTVQMSSGFLPGTARYALYPIQARQSDSVLVDYQLINERDQIIRSSLLNPVPPNTLQADTLILATNALGTGTYRLMVQASCQQTKIVRFYPFKIYWETLPDYIEDLDAAILQLRYIATDEEQERFQTTPLSQREKVFAEFWKKRDPTPSTLENERMEEYYRRVHYANETFSGQREGWETDMGQIYIIFGPPTEIDRHPFDIDRKPYEIWNYYDISRQFLFVDENGFGEYRLRSPLWDN